jgi:hypothetical protein
MTFNTGNNVPSTDPRDLYDNAENLDKLVNGADPFYADRLGKLRESWAGIENSFTNSQEGRETAFELSQEDKESRFQAFLVSSGYVSKGDYAAGVMLEERNEYVFVSAATTGTTAGLYFPAGTAAVPLTLTGDWATDLPKLALREEDVLRQELASSIGASLIGYRGKTLEFYRGLRISPYAYGAVGDGVADDTDAVQQALDALTAMGGGTLEAFGRFLVGGLIVNTPYVLITGRSERDQLLVKNGTLGIHVKQHWVNFENITIKSQGTKGDGLGTNGILYDKGGVASTGFVLNRNLTVTGFSGYGVKVVNAISYSWQRCYVVNCVTGVEFARDAGNVLFSTTVFFDNVYVTSCTVGINGSYVYRSRFNVIGEFCDYAMDMFAGDFTLHRCYFENNNIKGARTRESFVQDQFTYSNNTVTDAVDIQFTGITPAASRGYRKDKDFEVIAKRLAVLAGYGVDPQYLAGHGTTQNLGLKYGESTVALVRGPNLLNPRVWASQRTTEFQGWNHIQQGYEISGTSAGDLTHGMQQNVVLDSTKTYILDFAYTPISGTISALRVGADTVTSGVPFKPSASGSQAVKAFGLSAASGVAFEMYVQVFTLAEVIADIKQVAEANDRLTRQKEGRGAMYDVAAPTTGSWRRGERIYHASPSAGGFIGWVCTASGSPGTWKTFGAISA